jgi:hypothetical protein
MLLVCSTCGINGVKAHCAAWSYRDRAVPVLRHLLCRRRCELAVLALSKH